MKISTKPTLAALVRAEKDSKFYGGDIALVTIHKLLAPPNNKRTNNAVTTYRYYRIDGDSKQEMEKLLKDRQWVFIELDKEEQNALPPAFVLMECYISYPFSDGTMALDTDIKHENDVFYTEVFSISEMVEILGNTPKQD